MAGFLPFSLKTFGASHARRTQYYCTMSMVALVQSHSSSRQALSLCATVLWKRRVEGEVKGQSRFPLTPIASLAPSVIPPPIKTVELFYKVNTALQWKAHVCAMSGALALSEMLCLFIFHESVTAVPGTSLWAIMWRLPLFRQIQDLAWIIWRGIHGNQLSEQLRCCCCEPPHGTSALVSNKICRREPVIPSLLNIFRL